MNLPLIELSTARNGSGLWAVLILVSGGGGGFCVSDDFRTKREAVAELRRLRRQLLDSGHRYVAMRQLLDGSGVRIRP